MAGILWLCAPYISSFYNEPRLTLITRWCALGVVFNSLSMTNGVVFVKNLQFKQRSIISLSAVLISGVGSIIMANRGFGVWALVAQSLIMQLVIVILYLKTSSFRIRLTFDFKAFKEMFAFGHNLMLSFLLRAFFENIYTLVIGKFYSPADIGFFQRAKRFSLLCSQMPAQMISQVNFPMLCKLQGDSVRMLAMYRKVFKSALLVILPLLMGMAVTAPNMTYVLVGEKWMPSVPYLRVFCVIGVFYTVFLLNTDVIKAAGDGRGFLRLEMTKHIMTVFSILCLFRFGITAMLYGELASMGIAAILSARKAMSYIQGSIGSQFKWAAPALISAGIMGFCVIFVVPEGRGLISLMAQICSGGLVYLISILLMRDEVVLNVLTMVWNRYMTLSQKNRNRR
jgi:O-antigen/teichoic acid export membrane protein